MEGKGRQGGGKGNMPNLKRRAKKNPEGACFAPKNIKWILPLCLNFVEGQIKKAFLV